jgi:hypothetical protein
VEERDRVRVAPVLAADAQLEPFAPRAPEPHGDAHQLADAVDVDGLERRAVDDPPLQIGRDEAGLDIVAGEAQGRLCQVPRDRVCRCESALGARNLRR